MVKGRGMNRVKCALVPLTLWLLCASGVSAASPYETSKPQDTSPYIDFEVALFPEDPFSDLNQPDLKERAFPRGTVITVVIWGKPKEGYHTYPVTQASADPAQAEGQLTRITFEKSPGLEVLPGLKESEPEFAPTEGVGVFLEHSHPVTWSKDVLILPDAQPGEHTLKFSIALQVCDASRCRNGTHEFAVPVLVSDKPVVPLSAEVEARRKAPESKIQRVPVPANLQSKMSNPPLVPGPTRDGNGGSSSPKPDGGASSGTTSRGAPAGSGGVFQFMLLAISAGLLSLLTPCVFPMIPITVSYFLKQSDDQKGSAFLLAGVYSTTIIVVLTVGGLLLIPFLQPLSQHWITNLALGALFIVLALSLFGMYDITLPNWLSDLTASRQGQGGIVGTVFMALTFTIISFACVGPVYAGFMAGSASTIADWSKLALGALLFSVAFAAPFFLLALFPTVLRQLPRGGSWMNTVKVVMGFLEFAAAFKFLRSAELYLLGTGRANFLTYELVLGIWVALSILCGLYLLNLYRLPHDHGVPEQLGVPRLLFSVAFISLGLYLLPGLFKEPNGHQQRPAGTVFTWVDSFLLRDLPEETTALAGTGAPEGGIEVRWNYNLEKGLAEARERETLVFVDFTGVT
jgi:thiol:disulfide interchange protein